MHKKIFCIALFVLMLVGMTCVVASEDISTDNNAIGNAEELEVQSAPVDDINDELSTSYNDDIVTNGTETNTEKLDPNLNSDIETNEEYVTITSTVDENATGNVSIQITKNDETKKVNDIVEIENGTATWAEFIAFDKGNYTANITYLGDDNYYSTSISKEFEIPKLIPDFRVRITTNEAFVRIAAITNENATGTVTIRTKTFEEENYTDYATLNLDNGIAIKDFTLFPKGDYVAFTEYSGDDNYFKAASTQTFTIEKDITDFNVTVTTNDCYVELNATLNPNATGNIIIYIKNAEDENFTEYATKEIENGTANWGEFIVFKKGNYVINTKYSGDDNFFEAENTQTFTIEKELPEIHVEITTDSAFVTIKANVTENATGNVTLFIKTFEEENYTEYATIELENGTATWSDFIAFPKGNYVAFTTYNGDDNYFKTASTQTFEIEKDTTDLNVTVTTNDCYVELNATVNPNATGNLIIYIKTYDEENFTEYATVDLENGTANWGEFIVFKKGDYVIYTKYTGDDNFFEAGNTQTFSIEKELPEIHVEITTEHAFVTITANVTENATGNVTFFIKTYEEENYTEYATIELENGTATWSDFIAFPKGNYVAFTTYNGDDNYFKTASTQTFEIEKEMPAFDVNITVQDYLIALIATLPENATGNVTIKIKTAEEENFTEYATVGVENGFAVWSEFVPFNKGDYVAYTTYSGDENYFDIGNTQTFTIEKQYPYMNITSVISNTFAIITVTLPDNATGVVTLTNGQTGEVKNVTLNGTPVAFTENLTFGYNIFQVSYSGDDYYYGAEDNIVETFKLETTLSTKSSVTISSQNTVKKLVKLLIFDETGNPISNGENVTITVNNKTYTGTLQNGSVIIRITASCADKYIPNKYNAIVTFDGNDKLKNATTNFTLVVKKGTPKLTASAKTFKVSTKTKKYTITLKNHKNKVMKNHKVTLKVNGKTYTARTNSNGKATFKITNLNKRANYIALIKYGATTYYNSVSKKVKITVKK